MATSNWHVQTTRDGTGNCTNVIAEDPVFNSQGSIWEFSKDNKVVFVIPREHVLYIKKLPT